MFLRCGRGVVQHHTVRVGDRAAVETFDHDARSGTVLLEHPEERHLVRREPLASVFFTLIAKRASACRVPRCDFRGEGVAGVAD